MLNSGLNNEFHSIFWGILISLGMTSPLVKTGYLPLVTSHHLLGDPPPSPSGVTSFMDDPLIFLCKSLCFTF